ncbi:MAG: cation:proton antiporter [Candidatus Atribacteria bacterium]|nr:cation:proton antiporter [Candidatus Atribacteria bacterium]
MFITDLLIILITAFIGRLLARKFKQPMVLADLIVGLVLGTTKIVEISETIRNIADMGVLLLLFSTGLAVNLNELKELGKKSFIVAFMGVIIPFLFGFLTSHFFGYSYLTSIFVGTALTATSIGISSQVLTEMGMIGMKLGTLIIGSAIIDDVIGIIAMGSVVGLAVTGNMEVMNLMVNIILTVAFILLSMTIAIKFFQMVSRSFIFNQVDNHQTLLPILIIGLIFAIIAEDIGLSLITGIFMAGLILGQTSIAKEAFESVSLIGHSFFIPIFFVTMGMQFNLATFSSIGFFAFMIILVAVLGKIIGCGTGAFLCGFTKKESLAVGIATVPRAEVALILANIGLKYHIVTPSIASTVIAMAMLTTLLTPTLLTLSIKYLNKKERI